MWRRTPATCGRQGLCRGARWTWPSRRPSGRPRQLYQTPAALREAFFGNAVEARQGAMAALALSRDRETEYGAALALALSGENSQSQRLAEDLEKRFADDTSVRFSYEPALRAVLALNHGEPATAIDLLQIAVPYDFSEPRSSIHGFYGALYPVYVRGQAYLAAGPGRGSRHGVPEDSGSPRRRAQRSHRCAGTLTTGQSASVIGRHSQGKGGLPGFSKALERRRPGHPAPGSRPGRNTARCSKWIAQCPSGGGPIPGSRPPMANPTRLKNAYSNAVSRNFS